MSTELLKWLRIIAPAVIMITCASALGWATGLWAISMPSNTEEIGRSLGVLTLGGLYYMLPFRNLSNREYFDDVSENIRSRLVQIAGLKDDRSIFTWKKVRGVFFHFVDNDKTLEKKSRLAHFNGFFWTTVADVRAITVAFCLVALGMSLAGVTKGLFAALGFILIAILSPLLSRSLTLRHKEIGNQQLEIIEQNYKPDLRKKLDAIRKGALEGDQAH